MVKIGMIGCGGIGNHHANGIKQAKGLTIVAGADPDKANLKKFAENHGVEKCYRDYADLLKDAEVEAVFVCTPTFLHKDIVIAAAKAGKHVFCEKPMAMTVPDCRKMIAACEKAGVKLMIAFVRRFDAFWGTAKKVILQGKLGRPVLWRHCSASGGPARPWFLDREKGGGPLFDGAVHDYDFLRSVFGDAKRVIASMKTYKSDSTALDTGTAIVQFKSGDEAMLCWSWGLPKGAHGENLIDILGPKGALRFSASPDKFPPGKDPARYGGFTISGRNGKERVVTYPKESMFVAEVEHFASCVENDEQPLVTGEDGLKATQIAVAVMKSSDTGRPVNL